MNFKQFNDRINTQFKKMSQYPLFELDITGQNIWDMYLMSFENKKIFRDVTKSEHDCNCCKSFVRAYGNICALVNGKLETIWHNLGNDLGEYQNSVNNVLELIENCKIQKVFLKDWKELLDNKYQKEYLQERNGIIIYKLPKDLNSYRLGIDENYFQYTKEYEDKFGHKNSDGKYRVDFTKTYVFNHFCIDLSKKFINFDETKTTDTIISEYSAKYTVFKKAMELIEIDSLKETIKIIKNAESLDFNTTINNLNNLIENTKKDNSANKYNVLSVLNSVVEFLEQGGTPFFEEADKVTNSLYFINQLQSIIDKTQDKNTILNCINLVLTPFITNSTKYISQLEEFIKFKEIYNSLNENEKDNWLWNISYNMNLGLAKLAGSNIGNNFVLKYQELDKKDKDFKKELKKICESFIISEDPSKKYNSDKKVSISQENTLIKQITNLGLIEHFDRRPTNIEEIPSTIEGYLNKDSNKAKFNLFNRDTETDNNEYSIKTFEKCQEIITIQELLSKASSLKEMEILLEGNMTLFNMTSPLNPNLTPLFKYNNNHSFTVDGGFSGESAIKQAVKDRGGNINAVCAVRLHFPDTTDDYDLYITEPNSNTIYYGNKRQVHKSSGMLDLDAQGGDGNFPPEKRVENGTWTDKTKMPIGDYKVYVNNHPSKPVHTTFYMDCELDGELTQLKLKTLNLVKPHVVTINWNGKVFSLKPHDCMEVLHTNLTSKKLWNLDTLKFHKVVCLCPSPDHWTENVGTLHYLFALKNCYNDKPFKAFHIDNVIPELLPNRKALLALSEIKKVQPIDNQFAGVCFNSTYKRTVIIRTTNLDNKKEVFKVKIN